MKARIHHVALNVADLDWYLRFFQEVFGMQIERTRGEAPGRCVWLAEGIQLNEKPDAADNGNICDHISIGTDAIPETVARAIELGCAPLPNGAHWFALPNGAKVELKPYR